MIVRRLREYATRLRRYADRVDRLAQQMEVRGSDKVSQDHLISVLNVGGLTPWVARLVGFHDTASEHTVMHALCRDRAPSSIKSIPNVVSLLDCDSVMTRDEVERSQRYVQARISTAVVAGRKFGAYDAQRGVKLSETQVLSIAKTFADRPFELYGSNRDLVLEAFKLNYESGHREGSRPADEGIT
jgi:hypothetical protein